MTGNNGPTWAKRLRNHLQKHGLTAAQFADKAGLSYSAVLHYLNGSKEPIRESTVKKLEAALKKVEPAPTPPGVPSEPLADENIRDLLVAVVESGAPCTMKQLRELAEAAIVLGKLGVTLTPEQVKKKLVG
ncbi:MAG: hypothetical protein RI911_684 [Candidatus Parcubacteria bacterium]|jgi:transcriptional regulator with XRE-family HTH domain